MGLSFAGGLALIAATDPRFEPHFMFVLTVGAHDDLGRVLRFFVSNEAPRPDGTTARIRAHDYGPVIVVYSHAQDFFPEPDVARAREVLRLWLHEDFDAARAHATSLSPEGAEKLRHVFDHDVAAMAPELSAEIARLEPALAAVSPSSYLHRLRVPVFILHGAGDTVIPPTEAEWLAREIPTPLERGMLVSHALEHVSLERSPPAGEQFALVHFMGEVLEAADQETR
jgi:pimeloyl-ACP methyl ester carboxylesterase